MGQAKRRKAAAAASAALPKQHIARAIRSAVLDVARSWKVTDGFCALHAAVGQRILQDRFGLSVAIAAGDLQRVVNDKVIHTYAHQGERIDADAGACHVWLVEPATQAVIDFDAWEEPVRYEAAGAPNGPWSAPRPAFYWTVPGEPSEGIAKIVPDGKATSTVLTRLQHGATALFIASAVAKAQDYLDAFL